MQVLAYTNIFASFCFVGASACFLQLSEPARAAAYEREVLKCDVNKLTCWQRYVSYSEMLLATWAFTIGTVVYCVPGFAYVYYGTCTAFGPFKCLPTGWLMVAAALIVTAIMFIWTFGTMPGNMQHNDGDGSSYLYSRRADTRRRVVATSRPATRIVRGDASRRRRGRRRQRTKETGARLRYDHTLACCGSPYLKRKVGTDGQFGNALFLFGCAVLSVLMVGVVVFDPTSIQVWLTALTLWPLTAGIWLILRAFDPDTGGGSILFGDGEVVGVDKSPLVKYGATGSTTP